MKWYRKDIDENKTILTSNLVDNDPRYSTLEENQEIKSYGIRINNYNGSNELQFWIDKEVYNETEKIQEFNEKCKIWDLGKYIENKIILSINDDDVDFNLFKFIEDDDFEKNYKRHLLTYDNKEVYIKTNRIENFDVEENGYNQKYIRLQYDNIEPTLINFINNFENNIKETVNEQQEHYGININHDFLSIIKDKETKYIELKVKKLYIETKTYNNSYIYIRCNRIWDMDKIQKWGISLTVDKIQ